MLRRNQVLQRIHSSIGISLVLLSLVACGVSLIAIVDPVGSKTADDNDPFGPPPSRLYSLSVLGVSVVVGATGVYLIRRSFHLHRGATNVA